MGGRIFVAGLAVVALLLVAGCGGRSPAAPSDTVAVQTGTGAAFNHAETRDVDDVVRLILPQGQRRVLGLVSRRGGEPAAPQPIPATCSGAPARDFTILPFLASTILRDEDRVSGSNEELIAQAGPIGGAVRFYIEGTISGNLLQLSIRSEPPEFGYREQWTATIRSDGVAGVIEGQSSGTFTLNECLATWSGEPFVAFIRDMPTAPPPPTPAPPGGTPCAPGTAPGTASAGTMTAMIDGVLWCAPINQAVMVPGSLLIMSAGTPGMTLLALSTPAQIGTQTVGSSSPLTAMLSTALTSTWIAAGPVGSGSLTISTLTPTSATGTFSFTVVQSDITGQTSKVVTNGAFNTRIPTP
jgi:hypothetical protein